MLFRSAGQRGLGQTIHFRQGIRVREIAPVAVGDQHILVAIQVNIAKSDAPGPFRSLQAAELRDLRIRAVAAIQGQRVAHNLNISFNYVEGESMLMALKDIAISSGSACTSASLEPSYVLRALGRNDELAHSSIRFTIGRFTTEEEVDFTIQLVKEKIAKLRELSPLWEMHKDGIDLNTIQWAAH